MSFFEAMVLDKGRYVERQELANEHRAVLYVEHHINAIGVPQSKQPNVSMVIVARNASGRSIEIGGLYCKIAARELGTGLSRYGQTSPRGVKIGGFDAGGIKNRGDYNLRFTDMPAILLEPLFGSNTAHVEMIMSEYGRQKMVRALVETIRQSFPEGGLIALSAGHGTSSGRDGCAIVGYPETSEHEVVVDLVHRAADAIVLLQPDMGEVSPVDEPVMDETLDEDDPATPPFVPAAEVHPEWAKAAVEFVTSEGIMRGYPDGLFRGGHPVTRYELAAIMERLHADD